MLLTQELPEKRRTAVLKGFEELTPQLKASASGRYEDTLPIKMELAKAFAPVIRMVPLVGDTIGEIFTQIPQRHDEDNFRVPLDLIAPGEEGEFTAFTVPMAGHIPHRHIEGDEVRVPKYKVANSIDWVIELTMQARWDIITRALEIYRAGFIKKRNNDGWRLIISAAADRNILVYDADASAGLLTRRLFSLMNVVMKRNGGGNHASLLKSKLTDFYTSPEGMEDIRHWDLSQVPDGVREEMFVAGDGSLVAYPGITLHELYELGVGQEYQLYFDNQLGGTMGGSDVEIVVGLDRQFEDSFLMPVYGDPTFNPAGPEVHRLGRDGFYGHYWFGLACLDNRRVLLGSF